MADEDDEINDDEFEDEEESEDEDEFEDEEDDEEAGASTSARSGGSKRSKRSEKGKPKRSRGPAGPKSKAVALILTLTMGWIGADRFYLGSIPMGAFKLVLALIAGVVLFVDPVTLGTANSIYIAYACAYLALALLTSLQVYDFFMIGMGRAMSGGLPLDTNDNGEERSPYAYRGRAFLLGFFGGVIGLDRFYMKSNIVGGVKAGFFGVSLIVFLLALPSWQGPRDYPIAAKLTVEINRETPFYNTVEGTSLDRTENEVIFKKKFLPQGDDAQRILNVEHTWYIQKNASAKVIAEWDKATEEYFATNTKIGVQPIVEKDVAADAAAADDDDEVDDADDTDEVAAADDDDDADAAAAPVRSGANKKSWFNGLKASEILARQVAIAREEMWQEKTDGKTLGMGLFNNVERLPLRSLNGRDGMLTAGLVMLVLSFLMALADMLLIAIGSGRDAEGRVLGKDPLLATVRCRSCDEQMIIDVNNIDVKHLVCTFTECGRYSPPPTPEDMVRLFAMRDKAIGHTAMALSLFAALLAGLIGIAFALWPNASAAYIDPTQTDEVAMTLLYMCIALMIGSITHMVMAENSKPLCEF